MVDKRTFFFGVMAIASAILVSSGSGNVFAAICGLASVIALTFGALEEQFGDDNEDD